MALFSITTRAVGETLTAAKYNSDRNEIVAGIAPDTIPSTESDISHSNVTADPGETGSESLAANITGDIAHLKFIIEEMKGVTWRTSNATRQAQGDFVIPTANGTWVDAATTIAFYRFHVPQGWVTGTNILLHFLRRSSSASGTSRMTVQVLRARDGASISTLASEDIDFTPGDTNSHLTSIIATGGSLAVGDFVNIQITRLGSDGSDTNNGGAVAPDGHYFEWTGKASR